MSASSYGYGDHTNQNEQTSAGLSRSTSKGATTPGKSRVKAILQGKERRDQVLTCRICESKSDVGYHFSAILCKRCSEFFRKCLDDPVDFYVRPCVTRKQDCIIKDTFRPCSFCRAKKCLSIGLNRNFQQEKTRNPRKERESCLKPQQIGKIDCEELVRLLKKAAVWGKKSKEKRKRIDKSLKNALRRGLSNKWYAKYRKDDPNLPGTSADYNDQPPVLPANKRRKADEKASLRPILPKPNEPQVILLQLPLQPTPQLGGFLNDAMADLLERVKRIRFEEEPPVGEFIDVESSRAKSFLYNSSERPVVEHWRRVEAHINDSLCALVKFSKLLPEFDRLVGDEQHALLSGTLLEMLFISNIFFIDEHAKKLYLNSGCVYSLHYLAHVFSGCSGAGDFYRSLFEFCRRLRKFVSFEGDENKLSYERLGLILAVSLFSPPPGTNLDSDASQKQFLAMLKSELEGEAALSSLLECLSSLGALCSKHKRMVTSIRDDLAIDLAVDLHAELLQLEPKIL